MPLYTYQHPETEECIDIVQSMSEDHIYVDKTGLKWKRVFYAPQASIDANIDPFSKKDFKRTYGNKSKNRKIIKCK